MPALSETTVAQAGIDWLEAFGWRIARDPEFASDMAAAKRRDYGQAVPAQRLGDNLTGERASGELPIADAGMLIRRDSA
jgi:hypothetical protein